VAIAFFGIGVLFSNCNKTDSAAYFVAISNQFVEPIYNCTLGTIVIDTLNVNQSSPYKVLSNGNYQFHTLTQSGLLLSTTVTLGGGKDSILLIVNNNGKLVAQ